MGKIGFGFIVGFVAAVVILKLLDDDESWVVEVPMEATPAVEWETTLNSISSETE